ncbi:MAG TPA: hypothetical protein VFP88_05025 [Rhodanobacteraceae bacterium]|nr:hypothetical protein [Rhodanobacteraceae bacterium]
MKMLCWMVSVCLLALGVMGHARAATYYVRTDGGTARQCNGTADAARAGSRDHACAWNSPMQALPPEITSVNARIQGGDTLIIGAGAYPIGWMGELDCAVKQAPQCVPQAIPSGTAGNPTRILGAGWDSGCPAPPQLWGTHGARQLLSLDGSSHVEIACLDLSDHSNCTQHYRPDHAYSCPRGAIGDWALSGLRARDSSDVTLQDLRIHGFASEGVQAGRLRAWTVTRVKIIGNGRAGWNGDLGGNSHNSSNDGRLLFTDLEIGWNGCAEDYPDSTRIINCYGQNEGGYGDGFSEAWTGGDYIFIRADIHDNTQDGLDLRYANGTGSITVDQGHFARNNGNDLKTMGSATITHSVFVAYCSAMKQAGYPAGKDTCRAGGGEFAAMNGPNQTVTFAYNTVTGESGCLFGGDSSKADSSDTYLIHNNIFLGGPRWNGDGLTCLTWFSDRTPPQKIVYRDNVVWKVRGGVCPGDSICKDPQLENETLGAFDPTPRHGSPARHAGARAAMKKPDAVE